MMRWHAWIMCLLLVLGGGGVAWGYSTNDANTLFSAYQAAFYVTNGGNAYYKMNTGTGTGAGWWTFAEEIEMAEDAYYGAPSAQRQNLVASLCNGFASKNGTLWTGNEYNDDISWAVIAFSRAYLITGNPTFRNIAKTNFDAMYRRAWDTDFMGGGLWWRTDKQCKNACVNGPAAIGACLLYGIYGERAYLDQALACYAWERRVLFNPTSGAVADSIGTNKVYNYWASTYNQGTFIGAANFLHRATGLPMYYQDAILAARYTQNSIASAGILPEYGSGDFGGFNGIFARWIAQFARDQNLWPAFGPWLNTNANAAWSMRNTNNLAWQKWKTPTPAGTNVLDSWDCSDSVVMLHVAAPDLPDALQVTPAAGFIAVTRRALPPSPASCLLALTNAGATALSWTISNTSAWLSVTATNGLLAAGSGTNLTVRLLPALTTNLAAGRYYATVGVTNLASSTVSRLQFVLVISSGDAPLGLTGFNAQILAPNSASASAPNATAFDLSNNYCLYQAGLKASTRGLPPDGVFTSQWDGKTVFQLMPYGGTNALVLGNGYPSSGTLVLDNPRAYSSLSILAASAGGGGLGSLVLNFTNGTHSQALIFNAQDWSTPGNNIALQGVGRLKLGTGFAPSDPGASNPCLYQTTLNLAALGLHQALASITFSKPGNAATQQTVGIFAVSGFAAYREPVITQQPAPTNLCRFAGASLTWSVTVEAGFPVYYYWRCNGTVIQASTSSALQFTSLQPADAGNYTVIVSNSYGMVTSSVAALTVVPAPACPFGQMVQADGALGYWRLEETNGTVAYDCLAGNNGEYTPKVLLGQPGYKLLDPHGAARFGSLAASNSCVTNISVDFSGVDNAAFSVEAWVNGGPQTTDAGLVTKGYGGGGEQFNLDCGGSSHAFRFFVRDSSGSARLATSGVIPNSQWHHLVGICDQANGYVCLYVDGTNVAQATITANLGLLSSSLPMSIGARKSGAATAYDNQFVGGIEEVAVYGFALSSNQVRAHYQAAANRAPAFLNEAAVLASASAGQAYSGTLAAWASDPNGDAITFAKITGPAWLSVAGNGSLAGTPYTVDVGTNQLSVRATDPGGLFGAATLTLVVVPAPPLVATASRQGGDLLLRWTGGIAPYQVQFATNLLTPAWQNLGGTVNASNVPVSPTNRFLFYRVYGR